MSSSVCSASRTIFILFLKLITYMWSHERDKVRQRQSVWIQGSGQLIVTSHAVERTKRAKRTKWSMCKTERTLETDVQNDGVNHGESDVQKRCAEREKLKREKLKTYGVQNEASWKGNGAER